MDWLNITIAATGFTGTIGLIYSLMAEKRYKKAKKLLDKVKASDLDSIKDAANSAKTSSYQGFVSGKIAALDKNEVVYSEFRPRVLSLLNFASGESNWTGTVTGTKFALRDDQHELLASPTSNTKSFGLQHKLKTYSPLVISMQAFLLLIGARIFPQINLGTSEYMAYNGQHVTLFGTISYDSEKGKLEMPKIKFLFSGAKKDVELYLAEAAGQEWWSAVVGEILTIGMLGTAAYFVGKKLKAWYMRKKQDKAMKQLQNKMSKLDVAANWENDFKCAICYENIKNVIYRNCNHIATCSACDAKLTEQVCPICRSPILSRTIIALE